MGSQELAESPVPLCVDLDGTLLRSDLLAETAVAALKRNPLVACLSVFWLFRGKAQLKRQFALRARIEPGLLPYDAEIRERVRRERAGGRRVVLATAADSMAAAPIASHLALFDEVVASDGVSNLKGEAKASALVARFGERGFDYLGNDRHDLPVWKRSRKALVANPSARLSSQIARHRLDHEILNTGRAPGFALLRLLRPYQWVKNLLVLVPLLAAHLVSEPEPVFAALLLFATFCLASSATYIANDIVDLEDDRRHPRKRNRPLAAGEVSIVWAFAAAATLLAFVAVVGVTLLAPAAGWLALYVAASLGYSLWLKRLVLVDVFVLSGLYTLRVLAGAAAVSVPVSHWLLAVCLFGFLSLAFAKRFVEVDNVKSREERRVPGRGYLAQDGIVLGLLGAVCGFIAVLVFALYITSREVTVLYRLPAMLWIAVPMLLYWMSRVWLLAFRGKLDEDPLIFALRDAPSWAIACAVLVVMFAAT
jgi:4-hydroxybenzoate polyprenyltransferase/phosphoserine phosphatase